MSQPDAIAALPTGGEGAADPSDLKPWTLPAADRLVVAAVLLALFMAALEQTIVGPALPVMGAALGDVYLLPWTATAYLLAATAMGPIFGALADNTGRRRALYLALGLFMAGAVGAALAPSMPAMIAARLLQGAGAGGLVSLPFVVIADKIPMRRRASFAALISTLYAVASLGGPLLGGFLTQYVHWSWIFWLNLPLGAVVLLLLVLQGREERHEPARGIDFMGALLLLVASTSSILTLEFLAGGDGPQLAAAAFAVTIAVLGWLAFSWRLHHAKNPLVPIGVLTEPTILLCTLGLLCTQGAYLGLSLYLPIYYQHELGLSAAQSGTALLGFVGSVAAGAYLPARRLIRDPRYKGLSVAAAAVALLGAVGVLLALAGPPSLMAMEIATILVGFGVGALFPTFTIAAQNAAGRGDIGAATGMLSFTRSMGGATGVALTGMAAVAAGLTGATPQAPVWLLGLVAAVLLSICLVAMALLPPRRLGDG